MRIPITPGQDLCIHKPLFLWLCFFIFLAPGLHAQSVGINATGSPANPSALLDIDVNSLSTKKGLLIPRMTLVQRTAMNPLPVAAQGLMVYQTDAVQGLYYNTSITTTPTWIYVFGSNSAWSLTGNSGTVAGTHFLGTTDPQPLMFKVNNQKAGYIDFDINKGNAGFGYQALNSNTGLYNSAFGHHALYSNTVGTYNTAVGIDALYSNTVGNYNTANGVAALYYNVAGNFGVAIGYNSQFYANNTASSWDNSNTSIGHNSLFGSPSPANNTGIGNTAIGRDALHSNSSGGNNTANGYQALFSNGIGSHNTANGYQALYTNATGAYNTANGMYALYSNTEGNINTANGVTALYSNTTGGFNTANGYQAFYSNVAGNNGVAIGYASQFYSNNTASSWDNTNTSVGTNSLRGSSIADNNTGINNTAIGRNALSSNTSGNNNTALGYLAGNTNNAVNVNTTGSNNTFLGYNTGFTSGTQRNNATAIGYNAQVNASNNLILGGTGADAVNVGTGVTAATLAKLQVQGTVGNTTAFFSNTGNSAGISLVSDWPSISYNCYYNGSTRAMSSSGYPAIIQGDQSAGGLTFSTTNVANTVAGNLVTPFERMRITGAGYVGIGTNNPTKAMLEINGSQSTFLSYGYLNVGGAVGTAAGTNPYSLYASDRIAATEFDAFSDARIKKVIGPSNNKQDLSMLMGIRITDYTYVDNISKDSRVHKKVIAQELEKVFPNAVNKITDEVPDIFKPAEIKDGKIIIANDLKVGEKVKLIFKDRTELLEVLEADANSFRVKVADQGKVFVYGRQVSDFRTVDYEALTTLSISAIQELYKDIESLKADNASMKSDLEKIKAQLGIPAMVKK